MLNQVILETRIVKNIGLKHSPKGFPFLKLVVVFDSLEKKDNEWQTKGNFIQATLFGKRAEKLAESLKPGVPVIIRAKLQQDEWIDKENQKRKSFKLAIDDLHFAKSSKPKFKY